MQPTNLGQWLKYSRRRLAGVSEQPGLEAALLASYDLDQTKTWILAHPETVLTVVQTKHLDALVERLINDEPLPYILGRQEFYGLTFRVNPCVLIPRPETELLVEQALDWLHAHPTRRRAADVGTGSGCIAVSLAWRTPDLHVWACDRSWDALRTARENARVHQVSGRLTWHQANLLNACHGPFDLVCANLPYIPTMILTQLAVARTEPLLALDGGPDGLDLIRQLVWDAARWLSPGGLLLLEIEASQGQAALSLAREALPQAQAVLLRDLAGLDRLLRLELA